MPGPPPPPAPAMMPPPPTLSMAPPKGGGSDNRGALLQSIQKGTRLKKAVTNDRSAPIVGNNNKPSNNTPNVGGGGSGNFGGGSPVSPAPNGLNLGGLFAGGMPKLRATGKLGASNLNSSSNNVDINNSNRRPEVPPQPAKSFSNIQNELKRQLTPDNKNRGPPPPTPTRLVSDENGLKQAPPMFKVTQNDIRANQSSLHSNLNAPNQNITTHRKVKSTANLSSLDSPDNVSNGYNQTNKPVINHGKPNLAPKPPQLRDKPVLPKKLIMNGKPVSRAHSMKSPRSPSPQSPDKNMALKFGTVRNLSSVIGQSLANSTGNLSPRPRPLLNGRPNAPPPSIPQQPPPAPPPHGMSPQGSAPPPPSKTFVKPPNHAPPPPPTFIPQAPSHTPPPPPHRTSPRVPPPVPNNSLNAPAPPPRHSSMSSSRKAIVSSDLEDKYKHMFKPSTTFPKPPPYRHVYKHYGSKPAVSKQQAPQPPQIQSSSRTWDASSAC